MGRLVNRIYRQLVRRGGVLGVVAVGTLAALTRGGSTPTPGPVVFVAGKTAGGKLVLPRVAVWHGGHGLVFLPGGFDSPLASVNAGRTGISRANFAKRDRPSSYPLGSYLGDRPGHVAPGDGDCLLTLH